MAGVASRIITTVQGTDAVTLEAWVKPTSAGQGGPARIVSISNGSLFRNMTLGHGEPNGSAVTQYDVRLRSTTTDNNSKPSLTSTSCAATTNLTHLVRGRRHAKLCGLRIAP